MILSAIGHGRRLAWKLSEKRNAPIPYLRDYAKLWFWKSIQQAPPNGFCGSSSQSQSPSFHSYAENKIILYP